MRGSWRPNITRIFWPHSYGRQRCVFLILQGCSTGGPGPILLGDGFLYCILSASSLDPNSSGPQAPSAGCGFPYHTSSPTGCNSTGTGRNSTARRTQLSYIIVRRPLDLWNRMFNRHQAEITVMQFRGHSLLVHQSMSVPWEFFSSSHFISQFPPTRFPLITVMECVTSFRRIALEWHFWAGQKVKIQHNDIPYFPNYRLNSNTTVILHGLIQH